MAQFQDSVGALTMSSESPEHLTLEAFSQLSGKLAGYPFVKLVVEQKTSEIHFLNHARYPFHAHYIAEKLMGISAEQIEKQIDAFNQSVYLSPAAERNFYLGILALHRREERRFYVLETVEIDTMDAEMLRYFYAFVRKRLDTKIPLFFKPGNHHQETVVGTISPSELPRVYSHELFASSNYVALNPGTTQARIRAFRTEDDYRRALPTIEWHDILVLHRIPDDFPRVSGIINANHTTPLSHTNVLASGWGIPNAVQLGIFDRISREGLDGQWVEYTVASNLTEIGLKQTEKPAEITRPAWSVQRIKLEEPEAINTKIAELTALRMSDRYRYGTKAANLGELGHVLSTESERLLGFYRIQRPPRENLLPYLAKFLEVPEGADLGRAAWNFLRTRLKVPRGIAIPFSIQQEFLESSPRIQQMIGKLKMAIELNSREVDSLCVNLQQIILRTRMPEKVRSYIDGQIATHLAGVSNFVVRSSSNAEDLENFSAAGIYESINHVSSAENIFQSIKAVWASLTNPRSVRLRNDVGISLDDSYMGVIVQEEIKAELGGVLVTTNPMNRSGDFRNTYINVSKSSVERVVDGSELPLQYLFNTVEGGGRTLSLGSATEDLTDAQKAMLQKLAFAGRLFQGHFSPDYTFSHPVDIEWAIDGETIYILQLRPYAQVQTGRAAVASNVRKLDPELARGQ